MARILVATWWPLTMAAAARRSSMRPLVQEPRKTVSILMSAMGVPGEAHVLVGAGVGFPVGFGLGVGERGDGGVDGGGHAG
jgi:hypothetical protein